MWPFRKLTQEEKCAKGKHDWIFVEIKHEPHWHPVLAHFGRLVVYRYMVCSNVSCSAKKKAEYKYLYQD